MQDPGGVIRVTHVRKERRVGAYRAAVITILDSRLWRERGRVEVKHTEDREHSELAGDLEISFHCALFHCTMLFRVIPYNTIQYQAVPCNKIAYHKHHK